MKALLTSFLAISTALPSLAELREGPNPPADQYDDTHRFVFYAVLEGCYQDGLTNEEIDLIVPKKDDRREFSANFIYSCPLCHPAFEAFRLYGSRLPFKGQKVTVYDTFGEGLDPELRKQLRGDPAARRDAIQKLISRWIAARADLLRLTDEEKKTLTTAIEEKKKKGEAALDKFLSGDPDGFYRKKYEGWKRCPICSGAAEAPMGVREK